MGAGSVKSKEDKMNNEVEKVYNEFWKEIIEKPDGSIDIEQVKKELCDFKMIMDDAAKVYCHVTGDQISKVNTNPDEVIRYADDYSNKLHEMMCGDCEFKQGT